MAKKKTPTRRPSKAPAARAKKRPAKRSAQPRPGDLTGFHDRLESLMSGESMALVAQRTGVNHESVRRYRNGAKPSAEFIAAVARVYGVSADWLLGLRRTRR